MAARITKYHNKYMRMGICLIYMSSFYFWSPPLARKMRKTNTRYYPEYRQGPAYRTLVLHYLLQPMGVYTVFLYIFIKQRHVQTF
jgi:predicted MFS family arabinose efflux permease